VRLVRANSAFTLTELVIVILVLGILAGVAAPKLSDVSHVTKENTMRRSQVVVRNAIEHYTMTSRGIYPAQDKKEGTFKKQLAPHLMGEFPENPFGRKEDKKASIKIRNNGDPLIDHVGDDEGWLYDSQTGEFIVNSKELSSDGVTTYAEY
jgi:general secretion pathway protein G